MKRCLMCSMKKSITEFHRDSRARDGHRPYCKICNNQRQRERRGSGYGSFKPSTRMLAMRAHRAVLRDVRGGMLLAGYVL